VTSATRPPLQPKPLSAGPSVHGVLQRCGPVSCSCPDRDDGGSVLRRSAVEPRTEDAHSVPRIVHDVLRSPGRPLADNVQAFYETRFGYDFSRVRVHTDPKAADSARTVGARAYTVGTDIVLGDGGRAADMGAGSRLLAHELAHVVQQGMGAAPQAKLITGEPGSPAEREADYAADRIVHGNTAVVRAHESANVMQRQLSCPELISVTDVKTVSGIGIPAHDAIEEHFRSKAGGNFWKEPIPGASSTPFRTEDPDERRRRSTTGTERVKPQTVGGRAGKGTPDLGFKDGRILEVAEVKPAILAYGPTGGLIEGEAQLLNYIRKGNARENRGWRASQRPRVDIVTAMPPSRITWPGQLTTSSGQKIAAGWCLPGLVGYRPLSAEEAETILCGISDQKAIDKFLNVALDGAQALLDRFIDSSLDQQLTRLIQTLTVREGLAVLGRYGRDLLWDLLKSVGMEGEQVLDVLLGPAGTLLAGTSGSDALIDGAALLLEQILGPQAEALLRAVVFQAKSRLLADIRNYLKDRLRTYLQESLNAVCAAAAVGVTVSVAQLLRQFSRDLGKRFGDAVVDVALAWAADLAKEFAKDLGYALLIAIAVVALIFFLPAILAALAAAGEFVIAAAAALAALGPRLAPLLDQLVQELQAAF
jgi:Domain of unknown function (DUF4157)